MEGAGVQTAKKSLQSSEFEEKLDSALALSGEVANKAHDVQGRFVGLTDTEEGKVEVAPPHGFWGMANDRLNGLIKNLHKIRASLEAMD